MRADVMAELLEDAYASGDSRFEQFVETFAQGKTDAGIEDYIMQVYHFPRATLPERGSQTVGRNWRMSSPVRGWSFCFRI